MAEGSSELARRASAYLTGVAFGVTYLGASALGASMKDSLMRSCMVAGTTLIFGRLLTQPVVNVMLDAIARDETEREAERRKQEEDA